MRKKQLFCVFHTENQILICKINFILGLIKKNLSNKDECVLYHIHWFHFEYSKALKYYVFYCRLMHDIK